MEVYADVVFLINFIMDFFVFWVVSKVLRKKVSFLRLGLGAFLASVLYCAVIFISGLRFIYNMIGLLAILILSVALCFKVTKPKELIKLIAVTYTCSFVIGGAGMGFFYFTTAGDLTKEALSGNIGEFSFKILLTASLISYIIIKIAGIWYNRFVVKRQVFCNVQIFYNDNVAEVNALVDTGNSLHEPITKKPVIIAEFLAVKEVLPDNIKLIYYEGNENNLCCIQKCIEEERFRLIPFSSLGKKNGMIIGFKADKVEISDGKRKFNTQDVIIGIYNFKLSNDGFYNALLNPEVLEAGNRN